MEFTIFNNNVEYNNLIIDNPIILDKLITYLFTLNMTKINTYLLIVCTVGFIFFLTWKSAEMLGYLINWKKKTDDECVCGGGCSCCCGHQKAELPKKDKSILKSDVPLAWGLYFQDGATPSFEGIVDLHNRIMFYLVVILFGVSWVMLSIMWNFNKSENKLVYRYLNHGTLIELIW